MKIAVASDHAGFEYKQKTKQYLEDKGYEVTDFGTDSADRCDYPDFIKPAARAVIQGKCERAIVFGGSGNGEAIAANKVKGIRAALCWDLRSARLSREHNDANVLSMGQRMLAIEEVYEIIDLWLGTEYQGGRHDQRLEKIESA